MNAKQKQRRKITVAVSGGFDPVHVGHVRMFQEAKKLGDRLVVILNNDNWLRAKKGYVFMPEKERKELLEAIGCVDTVVLTKHPKNPTDMSVRKELALLKPNIFANGGDRTAHNTPETEVCQSIGCEMVFSIGRGGKIQSSSWLLDKHFRRNLLREQSKKFSSKKIFVFDLDGTLAQSKFNIDTEMAHLLCRLLEKKRGAVISGGQYAQFENQLLRCLPAGRRHFKNLLLLPTSGGALHRYDGRRWNAVYKHILTPAEKKKIFNSFKKAFRDIGYASPKKTYGPVIEDRKSQITFSALGQRAPLGKKEEWNARHDIRKELRRTLERYIPEFEIRLGGLTSVDVTKKGIDKAYGIEQMKKFWGARRGDFLYIGDALYKGGNDYAVKKAGIATLPVKNEEETKIFLEFLIKSLEKQTA